METGRGKGSSITSLKTGTTNKPQSSLPAIFHKTAMPTQEQGGRHGPCGGTLYQWLPRELEWDLYIAVRHVWESGDVPHHWLQARIAMIYKFGPLEAARSYRPISVATGMYSTVARLILDTRRRPIDAALSDPQAGCRRGYTTSQQALRMSMILHQYGDRALVCFLDIAKA